MTFRIDTASRLPIYEQLAQQVRAALARGDLQPGERLPSVRQMSQELLVNPNTIARAYAELERAGLVISRQGLGVFIAEAPPELSQSVRDRKLAELLDQVLTEAVHLGYSADEVVRLVRERVRAFTWRKDGQA
jgi:GntR family transcriptional regulator